MIPISISVQIFDVKIGGNKLKTFENGQQKHNYYFILSLSNKSAYIGYWLLVQYE